MVQCDRIDEKGPHTHVRNPEMSISMDLEEWQKKHPKRKIINVQLVIKGEKEFLLVFYED